MAADKDSADDMMVATESFVTNIDGTDHNVHAGKTRVRRSHPLYRQKPEAWELFDSGPTVVETATRGPGERRGAPGA